jgi:hypothetical protein
MCREVTGIYCGNHIQHTNSVCGQNNCLRKIKYDFKYEQIRRNVNVNIEY